ncbi:MAG: DNA alkylation repair protein, partial [Clostridia bacterium]|nr:DNA alkylation repair protein [Clostridia bacterium]
SDHPYTVRFAVGMLMQHFLDEDFDPAYLELVAGIRSDEYYVNMMIAWYFATALAKQYDAALPYIEQHRLAPWTHNKAIQKAAESYRVPPDRKAYLKTCRMRIPYETTQCNI